LDKKIMLAAVCVILLTANLQTVCAGGNKEKELDMAEESAAAKAATTNEGWNPPADVSGTAARTWQNITDQAELARRNAERATSLAETFHKDFFDDYTTLLKLYIPQDVNPRLLTAKYEPATNWEYGALMSMQSQLAIMDAANIERLRVVNSGLEYYGYMKNNELWGYVVHRGDKPLGATDPGLAYDDGLWLTINFLRSYETTNDAAYLAKAEEIMHFILTDAWFEPLGGLFWDTRHEARHSCSNNPAIKPLVDLYNHTGKAEYLDWAKRIFEFSIKLKNKERNIYEDLVRAHQQEDGSWREGIPGGGYYTYNTGTMISAGAALYGVTGEQRYLDEALMAAQGAYAHFAAKVSDNVTYWACTSNIWFNNILLRGYLDLYPYAKEQTIFYINTFQNSMDFAYEHYLYKGYMPINWSRGWGTQERDKNGRREALDHSANVEMYAMLANWQRSR
jgi:hypothetical protein